MRDCIFIYGTLLPDLAPPELRNVIVGLRPIASGTMAGRLYDLGDFPGAVFERSSGSRVFGQVYELPHDDDLLILDEYEEYAPEAGQQNLFVREKRPVTLASGLEIPCWVYVYNRDPGTAPPIDSGDYVAWIAKQASSRS